ncbi:hypothetical protein GE09DRAFT_1121057 [Coniochaeta sp. 2T2.1]|nr:hypothetical protein GE09DRAFT_1121057 [Coniochaeta sp. 2T2.1]
MPSVPLTLLLTLLTLSPPTSAQSDPFPSSPSTFPKCATTCLSQAVYLAGCVIGDSDCVCRNWVPIDSTVKACIMISNVCTADEMFRMCYSSFHFLKLVSELMRTYLMETGLAQLQKQMCSVIGYGTLDGVRGGSRSEGYPTAIESTDVAAYSVVDGAETLITAPLPTSTLADMTTSSGSEAAAKGTSTRTITATVSFSGTKTIGPGWSRTGGLLTAGGSARASNAVGRVEGGFGVGVAVLVGLVL